MSGYPTPTGEKMIEHQVIQGQTFFKVEQKVLSMAPTYKVKDMHDNELMVAEKELFSFFRPHIRVRRLDGTPIGFVQGNFFRTEWKFFDTNGTWLCTINFPFFIFFFKKFDIETPQGYFRSGDSFFGKKFDVYDSNGQLAFSSDKQYLKIRDTMHIASNGILSPFLTCMCAVVIDRKFYSGNK